MPGDNSTLLVEFDAIFDTRAAILNTYGEEAIRDNITNNYFTRVIDKFIGIDYSDFMDRYKKRDKATLSDALSTPIVFMISDFVFSTVKNTINGPAALKPVVRLNTYPYELLDEELKAIRDMMIVTTNGYADIEFARLSPAELTPAYMRDNVDVAIMYDYTVWLEEHSKSEAFKKVRIPDVSLLAPLLFFKEPKKSDIDDLDREGIDPFKVIQERAAPIVNLKLLPIHLFSIAVKLANTDTASQP